jgi:hypothetical protein
MAWSEADFALVPGTQTYRRVATPVAVTLPPEEPEDLFQERLRAFADTLGYLYFHQYSAKRSTPGMVDCLLCHPEGGPLFLWELKTATGVVSPAQRRWMDALQQVTSVDARIVRPADWSLMTTLLTRRR